MARDSSTAVTLTAGSRVRVQGLKGRPELNSQIGTVLRFVADRGRWEVQIDGAAKNAAPLGLKEENLEALPDKCHQETKFGPEAPTEAPTVAPAAAPALGICSACTAPVVSPEEAEPLTCGHALRSGCARALRRLGAKGVCATCRGPLSENKDGTSVAERLTDEAALMLFQAVRVGAGGSG